MLCGEYQHYQATRLLSFDHSKYLVYHRTKPMSGMAFEPPILFRITSPDHHSNRGETTIITRRCAIFFPARSA